MELFIILIAVAVYQWLVIPLIKRKIGYERPDEPTIFYAYKTKWQLPVEVAILVAVIALVALTTATIGIWSVVFIPIGMSAILLLRGMLEKKHVPYMNHHIISFIQGFALLIAFSFVLIYAVVTGGQ